MHILQNYGETEPTYDGNAYAFSSTYHDGQLKLFAHHATAPTTQYGQPEYHMTQIGAHALTHNRQSFVAGATAFRNARDLAQSHRNSFIEAANTRASQAGVSGQEDVEPDEDAVYNPDCVNYHNNYDAWQDADEALQQHVTETSYYAAFDDPVPEGVPQYLYSEDNYHSQELSQDSTALDIDNPSMSFTSSFTTASTERARSKRPRQSDSPPSKKGQTSKQRARNEVSQHAPDLSTEALAESGSSKSHWVEAYMHKSKVCFGNLKGQEVKTESSEWTAQMVDGVQCFCWTSSRSGRTFWTRKLPKEAKQKGRKH
jgi:hypothetical protein